MLTATNLSGLDWLIHGFGLRNSEYPEPITTVKQIHSGIVIEAVPPGGERIAEADGLVTREPGMMVGIRTADCVPVLIADERTRAVAAVHAGWRGTAQNIVAVAIREMTTRFGARAEDLHAAIGPAIGPCCYETGADVARQFGTWCPEMDQADSARRLNLPMVNERQLRLAGVRDVWQAGACTYCDAQKRFFSFRREKEQAGRMMSFVGRSA